jgi:glyoxylase-like metal-dependent hydrolase (beta-lactamase superfamily II)
MATIHFDEMTHATPDAGLGQPLRLRRDAVLTDQGVTTDQERVLGAWVAARGRDLTDIFVTHGHGDHWINEREGTARV